LAREKLYSSPETALADVHHGATILVGGFAGLGVPRYLLRALAARDVEGLTCVFGPGAWPDSPGLTGIEELVANGQVSKVVSPLPFPPGSGGGLKEQWQAGQLELEIIPQGTLAERLRAGGAGLGGIFLPTGVGTRFREGKESRKFGGQDCIFEASLRADFALLRGDAADTLGNLVYRGNGRNWGPVMAMAAAVTVAEVDRVCQPGELDPELVITPGIFVNRIVQAVGE
jgi:3-oxoadipate CoA-transferase alpha subunit